MKDDGGFLGVDSPFPLRAEHSFWEPDMATTRRGVLKGRYLSRVWDMLIIVR